VCVWMTVMIDGGQNLQSSKNSPYQTVLWWNKSRNGAQLGAGHL